MNIEFVVMKVLVRVLQQNFENGDWLEIEKYLLIDGVPVRLL